MSELPKVYKRLNNLFVENGYSLYMVGGTTRDFLLGKEIFDFDFVTSATPEQMASFLDVKDKSFNSGSVTLSFEGNKVDITTLREEGKYEDYRHPSVVNYVSDIRKDYPRRDFTINALYINEDGVVIDFVNGQRDLKEKVIRMIGNPFLRLEEDPLRILRAIRFASSLSFVVEEELKKAIFEKRFLLQKINFCKCINELEKMKKDNYKESLNKYIKEKDERFLKERGLWNSLQGRRGGGSKSLCYRRICKGCLSWQTKQGYRYCCGGQRHSSGQAGWQNCRE